MKFIRQFYLSVILITFVGSMLTTSCSQRKAHKQNTYTANTEKTEAKQDTLVASIKRTACYGQCPIYEINIHKNGYTTYEGERFVEREGKFYTHVSQETIDTILGYARHIGYFELEDEYMGYIADFPTVITTVNAGGNKKTIKTRSDVPEKLTEFQKFFDEQFKNADWKPLR